MIPMKQGMWSTFHRKESAVKVKGLGSKTLVCSPGAAPISAATLSKKGGRAQGSPEKIDGALVSWGWSEEWADVI